MSSHFFHNKGQITLHLTRDNFIILPKLYIFYKYLFKLISFSLVTAADEHNDRINNPVLFNKKKKKSETADRSSLTPTFHKLTCILIIYKPVESTTLDGAAWIYCWSEILLNTHQHARQQ